MRLRLTPRAVGDLEAIAAYLRPRSPQGAKHVEMAIRRAFALLAEHPEIGALRQHDVRRFPLPRYPYLIFYRLDRATETVDVLTVRHAARRPFSPPKRNLAAR